MKKTVLTDTEMPPGGWKLTVPETGLLVTAPYAKSLFKQVNEHRVANDLAPMERDDFEDKACTESGHGAPWCGGVTGPPKPLNTLAKVKRFLRAMAALARDGTVVSKDEHARRVKICEACPMNSVEGLGCHNCIDELREVEKRVGKMPGGNVLTCQACGGCVIWAKSWIRNQTLDEAEKGENITYPGCCWRNH